MATRAWMFGIALLAAGCGGVTVNTHRLNTPPHPMVSRSAPSVEVYTASKPTEPYVEVAMIEARENSAYYSSDEKAVFRELRKKAGQMGCDGLILLGAADSVEGAGLGWSALYGNNNFHVETRHGYRGTCIVMDDDVADVPVPRRPAAPRPAAPPAPAATVAGACTPPCSPGYSCDDGVCVAACNPPCAEGQTCGDDRICRANRGQ